MWLWHRLAATALIRPLAWGPPHAVGVTLKRQDKKKKKEEEEESFRALKNLMIFNFQYCYELNCIPPNSGCDCVWI